MLIAITVHFQSVLHLPATESRTYAAIPPLAMAVGMPLGGWLSDHLEHGRGKASLRKVVPMVSRVAILWNSASPVTPPQLREVEAADASRQP